MRWRTAVALLLLILQPAGGCLLRRETVRRCAALREPLEALEESLRRETPGDALFHRAEERWRGSRRYFSALTDHERIDRFNESLARIGAFLERDEYGEALAEVRGLAALLERLEDTDRLFLRNLL